MKRKSSDIATARNLLRPFSNPRKAKPFFQNVQSFRKLINRENALTLVEFAESKIYFPFPGLGNTFPSSGVDIPFLKLGKLEPLSESRELLIQVIRLNHYSARMVNALESLSEINKRLIDGRWDVTTDDQYIDAHVDEHGWSIVLLRKYLASKILSGGLPSLSNAVKELSDAHPRKAWAVYAHFFYDMLDPANDPSTAAIAWKKNLEGLNEALTWYTLVFREAVSGICHEQRAAGLLRYANTSLLDLVLYIWRNWTYFSRLYPVITSLIDQNILNALNLHFSSNSIALSASSVGSRKEVSDIEIYRLAFIFSDIKDISDWKNAISKIFLSQDIESDDLWAEYITETLRDPQLTPTRLTEIILDQVRWQTRWLAPTDAVVDPCLMRSALLAVALRDNAAALTRERDALSELIASASGIESYLSKECLQNLILADQKDDVLNFVAQDLIFKKSRTRDNDLERRLILMRIVQSSGHSSIYHFVSALSENQPLAAVQIATACTRTFLERLFLLMSSIKDVIKTRIEICQWLSKIVESEAEAFSEEIASLRRELANLDTRSDLDSTRIHVDEEALREWFWETQRSAVARYTQTVLAEGKSSTSFSLIRLLHNKERQSSPDEVNMDSQVGSEYLLIGIFSATLNAFASDKSFGLDAYLSRRIRHGTLSGSIMTPLTRVTKKIEDAWRAEGFAAENDFPAMANQWRKMVGLELDDARKNVIQLRSTNSERGLIRADWSTAANIAHLDAAITRIRSRVLESKGTYDIFPDLYALCWDCLAPDLAQLRRYLLREFLPKMSAQFETLWEEQEYRARVQSQASARELVSTFQNKIQDVCGWFIRPVFRRDSYSLHMLVTSTLSIVRELDESYTFKEEISISDEITLNRASFDVFGDLLFVVMGNAAKYGASGQPIRVTSQTSEDDEDTVILVEIQSFVESVEDHRKARARITEAMNIDKYQLARAATGEGYSGLGKAVGIMKNIKSEKAALAFYADENILDIRFGIYLPAKVAATRSRA